MSEARTIAPRCLTRSQAADYCGISVQAFDEWRRDKRVPGPIPGTQRWDRKALDLALDAASGIKPNTSKTPAFEAWLDARKARRDQYSPEKAG